MNPRSARLSERSISSEKRSIKPYALESDVPPLKTSWAGVGPNSKTCFKVQQTQKSFSTISAVMSPRRAAASRNRSRRSCFVRLAMSSMVLPSLNP